MSHEPPTVVVLDDDEDTTEYLFALLTEMGLHVVTFQLDPAVYKDIAVAQPRLVILDVEMGALDGIDVFLQLRANPATNRTPIIFFTGSNEAVPKRVPDYKQAGASLIMKPDTQRLSFRIREVLREPSESGASHSW